MFLNVTEADSEMCGECDVIVAPESCVICEIKSCGSVSINKRNCSVNHHTTYRHLFFIIHMLQSLSIATLAAGIVTAFNMDFGLCTMLQCDMET